MRSQLVGLIIALVTLPLGYINAEQMEDGSSLYKRMGGYDVIASCVDNFLERYDNDPELKQFLGGLNAAESARVRQHFVDYLCQRTGGPCLYLGRDMVKTHEGLAITNADYDRVMTHLENAFTEVGVPSGEKQELLMMLESVRAETVGR
ncbi:MAG: group I truncated hemoglobin [Gammaproteobacteria bacterium]